MSDRSPNEIARETFRVLAGKRLAPTPDHYQVHYHEVAGTLVPAPFPSDQLRLRVRLACCGPLTDELSLAAELVDFLIVLDQTGHLTYALVLEAIDSLDGMPELDDELKALKQAVEARQAAPAPPPSNSQQRSA